MQQNVLQTLGYTWKYVNFYLFFYRTSFENMKLEKKIVFENFHEPKIKPTYNVINGFTSYLMLHSCIRIASYRVITFTRGRGSID